ncbi:MAG: porin [Pseudomonadota bacterium]
MNKTMSGALALLGCACAGAALAQSQVQVYGVIDTSLVYTTNSNAAGDAVVKMPGLTGSVPSRLGFRGSEEVGDGMAVFFVLENGFNPDNGTAGQGNRLFGRQAALGLKGAYGTLTLGRQNNMTLYGALDSDVIGPNLFSVASLDPYLANSRSDNAIGYLGRRAGIALGLTYSLGRDAAASGGPAATNCAGEAPGNAKACRQVTALLGYDGNDYGLTTTYDILYGHAGAANGLSSSDLYDRRRTLNAYWKLGGSRLGGGVIDRSVGLAAGNSDSRLYYVNGSYQFAEPLALDLQLARLDFAHSGNDATMLVARLSYYLSKRTAVYSAFGHMDNRGSAAFALDAGGTVGAGMSQSGLMAGIRHAF